MHNRKLAILGASGHGKVIADIALLSNRYEEIFFLDDNEGQHSCMGMSIKGSCSRSVEFLEGTDFFIAIGNSAVRKRLTEELLEKGANITTLIHPNASIGSNVEIGNGSVIMAGAVLNAECKIGVGCIVNTCASVDHDCILGDYVHVSVGAHLAGNVEVGEATWVGAGAIVNNNIGIANSCMIGSGAVVVKNITDSGTYIGVPAKKMQSDV